MLCKLVLWLNINKLLPTTGKANFMVCRTNKRNCHFNADFKIISHIITRVESVKCLGIKIDEYLTLRDNINNMINKM